MRLQAAQINEDGSTAWGTVVVVVLLVLSLILIAYFVWYAPVMQAQQGNQGVQVTVPPAPSPTAEPPPGQKGAGNFQAKPSPGGGSSKATGPGTTPGGTPGR